MDFCGMGATIYRPQEVSGFPLLFWFVSIFGLFLIWISLPKKAIFFNLSSTVPIPSGPWIPSPSLWTKAVGIMQQNSSDVRCNMADCIVQMYDGGFETFMKYLLQFSVGYYGQWLLYLPNIFPPLASWLVRSKDCNVCVSICFTILIVKVQSVV